MALFARWHRARPPEYRARYREESAVALRDGVRLRTRRFGPDDDRPHPTILIRTPYNIGWTLPIPMMPILARFFARRGYNVVMQDTRGRYGSEGEFYPFVHEADDGRDTLDWVSKQPWFDGQLAMWGGSYFGYTQWCVADSAPPYLKALVPIVTTTDFHGLFYPGGAFSLISALRWAASNGGQRGVRSPERRLPAAARHRPMRDATRAVGRRTAFFEDWADHHERDDYWLHIDRAEARPHMRVPALLIAGTYDCFCGPQLEDFAALGAATCLDLGPYAHGKYAISPRRLGWKHAGTLQVLASSLDFFDHHLQGRPLERARVRRYVLGEDRWSEADGWPPGDARPLRLYLRSGGRLDREAPGGAEEPEPWVHDPEDPVPTRGGTFLGPACGPADQRPLESRRDVLRWETPPLERPLDVAGPVRLRLFADSDAPATDFTAKLSRVPADSTRPVLNLCDGVLRLPSTDGLPGPVEIDLWHATARLAAGDRLRLEVASSNFPRFDVHPGVRGNPAHAATARPARQVAFHDRDAPSALELFVRE